MENTSQALIIAGGILLAIIVLSLGVNLIVSYSETSESYEQIQGDLLMNKFNTNFTKFKDRKDITAQEIITLKNFAQNYDNENGTTTNIYVNNSKIREEDEEFIKKYAPEKKEISGKTTVKMKYFEYQENSIEYESNGRIKVIKFKEL